MLTAILRHSGFVDCLVDFFSDYLVGRSTQYAWVGIEDTVLDSIKLKSSSNHLLNELAKGVEQNNRSKDLRSVVGWFARLRDNDRD